MSKKILVVFCVIVFIMSIFMVNSYAAITDAVCELKPSKSEYEVGDTIEVTLRLSKLEADKGIIAYSGVLEYDKDNLEYVSIKGSGEWERPEYNSENGMLVATRSDFSPFDGEDLCVITFKAKSKSENAKIAITSIELSNGGNKPATGYKAETTVNIKDSDSQKEPDTPSDTEKPNDSDTEKPNDSENNTDNNQNNNSDNDNSNSNNSGNNNSGNNNSDSNNSDNNNSDSDNSDNNDSGNNNLDNNDSDNNNSDNNNLNNNNSNSNMENSNNSSYEKDDGSDKLTDFKTQNPNIANKIIPQTGMDNEYILALLLMTAIVGSILATRVIRMYIKK